jgi:hypothetical protein
MHVGLHMDLWLLAMSMVVDVVITASGKQMLPVALCTAEECKLTCYSGAVADGTIVLVIPFALGPFGSLSKRAQDFLVHTLQGAPPKKAAKAHTHIALTAVQGTGHLASVWEANMAFLAQP